MISYDYDSPLHGDAPAPCLLTSHYMTWHYLPLHWKHVSLIVRWKQSVNGWQSDNHSETQSQ